MRGFAGPLAEALAGLTLTLSFSTAGSAEWVRIETPHFSLLTERDPRIGRNVALEFEQARAVFQSALGAEVETALPIVIFAVRDRGAMNTLLPGVSREPPLGVFLSSPDRHRIAVRLDEPSRDRFQAVYHEYHHLLLRSTAGRAPVWLFEGLAEFWSHMEMGSGDGSLLEIGRPSPRHLRALRLLGMMPLGRLLRYDGNVHDEPGERIAVLYAQSWALVHHLMLGDGAGAGSSASGRARFQRYEKLVSETDDPVAAFEAAFGSVAATERALARYLDQTMFPVLRVEVPETPPASEFRILPVGESEAAAEIGMFLATGPWPERASEHLERALELDDSSIPAMEGLGFVRFRAGDLEAAETWFTKVAEAPLAEASYLAHYYLGLLTKRRGGASALVESSLARAIQANPTFAPARVALSAHLAEDASRLEEALALASDATRIAPEMSEAWTNLADVLTRMERPDEAREAMKRAR